MKFSHQYSIGGHKNERARLGRFLREPTHDERKPGGREVKHTSQTDYNPNGTRCLSILHARMSTNTKCYRL